MKRVLFWLLVLATVFGLLFFAGRNRDVVDATLAAIGIDTESRWFEEAVRLVLYIFVAGPILALMASVFALGKDGAWKDIHGYTVLRLKSGVRYTLPVASAALAALMYVASAETDSPWVRLVFLCFGLAFLLGGFAIWQARIRFDGSTLFVRDPLGGENRYDWTDLEGIEDNADAAECRLTFRGRRAVKISHYYSGIGQLIWLANEKRRGNARTS